MRGSILPMMRRASFGIFYNFLLLFIVFLNLFPFIFSCCKAVLTLLNLIQDQRIPFLYKVIAYSNGIAGLPLEIQQHVGINVADRIGDIGIGSKEFITGKYIISCTIVSIPFVWFESGWIKCGTCRIRDKIILDDFIK